MWGFWGSWSINGWTLISTLEGSSLFLLFSQFFAVLQWKVVLCLTVNRGSFRTILSPTLEILMGFDYVHLEHSIEAYLWVLQVWVNIHLKEAHNKKMLLILLCFFFYLANRLFSVLLCTRECMTKKPNKISIYDAYVGLNYSGSHLWVLIRVAGGEAFYSTCGSFCRPIKSESLGASPDTCKFSKDCDAQH